jgi:hypothetical protein
MKFERSEDREKNNNVEKNSSAGKNESAEYLKRRISKILQPCYRRDYDAVQGPKRGRSERNPGNRKAERRTATQRRAKK